MEVRDRASRIMLLAAVAAFAFPVYAFAHWIMVFDKALPPVELQRLFFAGFPYSWRSAQLIALLSLAGCVVAILLARLARRRFPPGPWALSATILLVMASALGAWNLFTMM